MIQLLPTGIYISFKNILVISEKAQLTLYQVPCMFAAAATVLNLTQSEATNESVTITWEAPVPLNSVVGYAVLVYDSDGDMICRTVTILDCDTCEVCELLTITDWVVYFGIICSFASFQQQTPLRYFFPDFFKRC